MAKLLLLLDLGHEDISSVIPQSLGLLSGGKLRSATRGSNEHFCFAIPVTPVTSHEPRLAKHQYVVDTDP
jgi:hypothetical protein